MGGRLTALRISFARPCWVEIDAIRHLSALTGSVNQIPNSLYISLQHRAELGFQRARSRNIDVNGFSHLRGPRAEDYDFIGKKDRLRDIVGDKDHRLLRSLPDLRQFNLQFLSGLSIH